MKPPPQWISLSFLLPLCACDSKNNQTPHAAVSREMENTSNILPLAELQKHSADYKDQKVTVAAYLFTHEEGPWIGSELKSPLKNAMSLVISESSQLSSGDPDHFRAWYHWEDGFPALITGTLRIGGLKIAHGPTLKNEPWIEVSHAVEVEITDQRWNGIQ